MDEPPLNSPYRRLGGWRKAAVALRFGRRISDHSTRAAEVDHRQQSIQTGAEQRDLEENSPPVLATVGALARLLSKIKRIRQLVRAVFNDAPQDDEHKQLQKRCSKYSQKALLFAITTFVAYLGSSSASSSTGNKVFKVAMAAFFIVIPIDLISATRTPKWGCALVRVSLLLLVLQSYVLLVSFHKDYICAIVPVMLFAAALLPWKQPSVRQQDSTNSEPTQRRLDSNNEADDQDKADQDLENIFDWSAGIVNCGGLISMILGHYMYVVGPNQLMSTSVIGFLFFFTVVMGLYLMMVTTVRTAALTPNVSYLAYLRDFLLVSTLIATMIHGVRLPWNDSHV